MIRLEPWNLGARGSGYVLRDLAGVTHIEIHCAAPSFNAIGQLMQIERRHGLSIDLLREQVVASIEVDPEGAFKLHSRLGPWEVVRLADEVMAIDTRMWFRGSRWRFQ